jgi:hypothetical protein
MGKSPNDRKQPGGYAAPITIDTAKNAERFEKANRVAIFEIDGTVYDMPAVARAEVGLRYLELANAGDDNAAAYYLMIEALGQDAYDALKGVVGLTDEQFEGVLVRVQAIILPKGSTPSSSRG